VYEAPQEADLVIDSGKLSIPECVDAVLKLLVDKGIFKA
jgi:adenylylsulfate kinase-like enzyme